MVSYQLDVSESSPVRDRRSTTEPPNQLGPLVLHSSVVAMDWTVMQETAQKQKNYFSERGTPKFVGVLFGRTV